MRSPVIYALSVALFVAHESALAQRKASPRPDLEGTWNGATMTPLQRPADFRNRAAFTPEEAAEYERTAPDRHRSRLPTAADRPKERVVNRPIGRGIFGRCGRCGRR